MVYETMVDYEYEQKCTTRSVSFILLFNAFKQITLISVTRRNATAMDIIKSVRRFVYSDNSGVFCVVLNMKTTFGQLLSIKSSKRACITTMIEAINYN